MFQKDRVFATIIASVKGQIQASYVSQIKKIKIGALSKRLSDHAIAVKGKAWIRYLLTYLDFFFLLFCLFIYLFPIYFCYCFTSLQFLSNLRIFSHTIRFRKSKYPLFCYFKKKKSFSKRLQFFFHTG